MINYTPFLKLKAGEFSAIKNLPAELSNKLIPLFDLPKKAKGKLKGTELKVLIDKTFRKYELNLSKLSAMYIDDFDIDDDTKINGKPGYEYLLKKFKAANIIPIIGHDRDDLRNEVVFEGKRNNSILSNTIGIRVMVDSLKYSNVKRKIKDLSATASKLFSEVHVILDLRVVNSSNLVAHSDALIDFISNENQYSKYIVAGSSITASIKEITKVNTIKTIERKEIEIYKEIIKNPKVTKKNIFFGDYATVSPNYSDVEVSDEVIRKITAPKIIYSYNNLMRVIRGASLQLNGNEQYFDLFEYLIKEKFFRGKKYSAGDSYISEKAKKQGKQVTPSSIVSPLVNAHISFMLKDFAI